MTPAVALLLLIAAPLAGAVGLRGEEGVPRVVPTGSADVRAASDAALRELNVRAGHYCPQQGAFRSIRVRAAAQAVISDALELELSATLDGTRAALLGMRRGVEGKWSLVRSEPYACEVRSSGGRGGLSARADIEKHNADPGRTFDRAHYKAFDALTDAQLRARLLRPVFAPPDDVGGRVAVELSPAVSAALAEAAELEKRRSPRGAPSPSPAPPAGPPPPFRGPLPASYDMRSVLGGACFPAVRQQGSCASCWAQSSAGMLEDRLCVGTSGAVRLQLSAQQHVSCDRLCFPPPHSSMCNSGCAGGFQLLAGKFAEDVGLVEQAALPYASGGDGSYEDHFTAAHHTSECPAQLSHHRHYRAQAGSTAALAQGDAASMQRALLNGGSLDAGARAALPARRPPSRRPPALPSPPLTKPCPPRALPAPLLSALPSPPLSDACLRGLLLLQGGRLPVGRQNTAGGRARGQDRRLRRGEG